MPNVYTGSTADGYVFNYSTTNATTARGDASTTGVGSGFTGTSYVRGIQNNKSARAGGFWWNYRSYFTFVLTGETVGQTVDTCKLFVYMDNLSTNLDSGGITSAHSRVIAVEATAQDVSSADYGNCFSSGSTLGTAMSGATTISSTAGYHQFAITGDTSAGGIKVINDAIGVGKPVICLMDYTWDYLNADIGGTYGTSEYIRHQVYYAEDTSGSKDPYLDITYTSGVTVTYNATFFGANF